VIVTAIAIETAAGILGLTFSRGIRLASYPNRICLPVPQRPSNQMAPVCLPIY
jgi:hypothetical protein